MGFNVRTNCPGVEVYYAGEVKGARCWSNNKQLAMKFDTLYNAITQMDELQRDFPFPLECCLDTVVFKPEITCPKQSTSEALYDELGKQALIEMVRNSGYPHSMTIDTAERIGRLAFVIARNAMLERDPFLNAMLGKKETKNA